MWPKKRKLPHASCWMTRKRSDPDSPTTVEETHREDLINEALLRLEDLIQHWAICSWIHVKLVLRRRPDEFFIPQIQHTPDGKRGEHPHTCVRGGFCRGWKRKVPARVAPACSAPSDHQIPGCWGSVVYRTPRLFFSSTFCRRAGLLTMAAFISLMVSVSVTMVALWSVSPFRLFP